MHVHFNVFLPNYLPYSSHLVKGIYERLNFFCFMLYYVVLFPVDPSSNCFSGHRDETCLGYHSEFEWHSPCTSYGAGAFHSRGSIIHHNTVFEEPEQSAPLTQNCHSCSL